jgi:hypothetical protein
MWVTILKASASFLVPLLKWVFGMMAKKKLNDIEFLDHIEQHQKRRQGAGKTAIDFDVAMKEAQDKINKENQT